MVLLRTRVPSDPPQPRVLPHTNVLPSTSKGASTYRRVCLPTQPRAPQHQTKVSPAVESAPAKIRYPEELEFWCLFFRCLFLRYRNIFKDFDTPNLFCANLRDSKFSFNSNWDFYKNWLDIWSEKQYVFFSNDFVTFVSYLSEGLGHFVDSCQHPFRGKKER